MPDYLILGISIGCAVFLIQQTDFIYEYLSIFLKTFKLNSLYKKIGFETYENSENFDNYINFIGSVHGVKKNALGFFSRLITCFICLNCFLSIFSLIFIKNSLIMIFPCFLLSMIVFYILFLIKKHVFA
jgi:hypothetical protein